MNWLEANWDFVVLVVLLLVVIYLLWRLIMQVQFTVNITIGASGMTAVQDPLNLTGQVGKAFSADLSTNVQGGLPPYSFAVTAGSLPSGLSLSGSVIGGVPTTPGTTTCVITASDSQP